MTPHNQIGFQFVDAIPDIVSAGVVYISVPYAMTVHRCACGCGSIVVLPLSRKDWIVTFDGETVSFSPSVWNRRMPCGAHYWIKRNRIVWVVDSEIEKALSRNWLVEAWHRVLRLWRGPR